MARSGADVTSDASTWTREARQRTFGVEQLATELSRDHHRSFNILVPGEVPTHAFALADGVRLLEPHRGVTLCLLELRGEHLPAVDVDVLVVLSDEIKSDIEEGRQRLLLDIAALGLVPGQRVQFYAEKPALVGERRQKRHR